MTGYGRGSADTGGRRLSVEIRSVNHRFLDFKLRGAQLPPAAEEKLRGSVKAEVTRGSVVATVRLGSSGGSDDSRVDLSAARRAHASLRSLSDSLGIAGDVPLELIVQQPGVLVSTSPDADEDAVAAAAAQAATAAVEQLVSMRQTEGEALARDLSARISTLRELTERAGSLAASAPVDHQKRLRERIERLVKNSGVEADEARVAQEVAVLADRLDVTEEIVRVGSHFEQFESLISGATKPIGRRLDFLVQEIGREFNTIGSKSQSADISSTVVEAKAELERVREQVQNIE